MFLVFLVVSLTPASATIMGQATGNNNVKYPTENKELTKKQLKESITNYQNKIEQITEGIKDDSNKLNVKMEELKDIPKWRILRLLKKANEVEKVAKDLEDKNQNLKTTTKNLNDAQTILDGVESTESTDDGDAFINARDMADKLQSRLNTSFDFNAYNGALNVSDVVQYKTDNGYYRYVTVNNITENNIILEGKDHHMLTLTKDKANSKILYKLKPSSAINSSNIVAAAYDIQKDNIKQQFEDAQDKSNQSRRFHITGLTLTITGGFLIAAWVISSFCVALVCSLGALLVMFKIGMVTSLVAASCIATGVTLSELSKSYEKDAKAKENAANKDLDDLTSFMTGVNMHAPVANNMSLNTTMNKNLTDVLNATDADGDKLNASAVSEPSNGNLTINGNKFVYTPAQDFVGNDTFNYLVIDNTGLRSNIVTVNIQVFEEKVTVNNTTITVNKTKISNKDTGTFLNLLNTIAPLFSSVTKQA